MPAKPTFNELLRFWLKLGFISFGGPAGQIGIMHEYLVEKKKYISESKFLHALNYCMVLPGPEAQQLATYIGWLLHGRRGGLAAGILFVLPSVFILLGLSLVYVSFGNIPWIYSIFSGLKPAVIAIVILALIKIGKKSLAGFFHYLIAFLAFVFIFFFNIPFPFIILGALLMAVLVRKFYPRVFNLKIEKSEMDIENEEAYFINKYSRVVNSDHSPVRILKQLSLFVILWLVPLILFFVFSNEFYFWKKISMFFTQAALVTFGGAYAVLPYVAQVSVEEFHWLTKLQMIDGLALGESTPGPLIMVLAFVGFMAGYNSFGGSMFMGSLGLAATTFYTFLPCFLFIFAGAPLIESTQENKNFKEILAVITAAVVGVILNLTLYLGKAVIFSGDVLLSQIDFFSLSWVVVSFLAMYRFNTNMILWIGISGGVGLLKFCILIN